MFYKFTGKHLCWKTPGKHQASGIQLYQKGDSNTCFPVKLEKFLRTPFRPSKSFQSKIGIFNIK